MIDPKDLTVFAETNYRDQCRLFGIKRDDRRRHMYIVGKTGMGKSTLLEHLIYSDIQKGEALAVIDPHGDLAELVLSFVPPHRINDVIYFYPGDLAYPVAFNILESSNDETKHLVASGLIGVFKKIWADSWGPRLEYVLRNTILALLDYPGSTLLGTLRLLTDKTYRNRVVAQIKDPVVRSFWVDEYAKYPDKFATEAIAPIQNKVGQFLSNSLIRNVVGQVKSSINIRDVMDNNKILIMNLSKGRIGEDTSALLGAMMITQIQLAAMSRVDIPEKERKDFYLYVDEFQNFATESFAGILSEARKYRLNLIVAHQYIEQLSEEVGAAIFGNVGTMISFRVGAADAEVLVKEFAPYFTEEDLVNLAKWKIYLKLMIDGVASQPFSANTLTPVKGNPEIVEKVLRVSRERYASKKEDIEDKISRWASGLEEESVIQHKLASQQPPKSASALANAAANGSKIAIVPNKKPADNISKPVIKKSDNSAQKVTATEPEVPKAEFEAKCSRCGNLTHLSFKPDGKRPVYCKDCLKIARSEESKKSVVKQPAEISLSSLPPRTDVKPSDDKKSVQPGETIQLS